MGGGKGADGCRRTRGAAGARKAARQVVVLRLCYSGAGGLLPRVRGRRGLRVRGPPVLPRAREEHLRRGAHGDPVPLLAAVQGVCYAGEGKQEAPRQQHGHRNLWTAEQLTEALRSMSLGHGTTVCGVKLAHVSWPREASGAGH